MQATTCLCTAVNRFALPCLFVSPSAPTPPPAPPPPVALIDYSESRSTYGEPVSGNLLTNALPPPGTTTTVVAFSIAGMPTTYTPGPAAVTVTDPSTGKTAGTLVISSDGTYTFTPAAGFAGSVPTVTYTVRSSDGQTDPSQLVIDVLQSECVGYCPVEHRA